MQIPRPFVTDAELLSAGSSLYAEFRDPVFAGGLSKAVMEAVNAGEENTFIIPAVKLAVDIAVAACMQDEVVDRLPPSITDRARDVRGVARRVGELGIETGTLLLDYRANEWLSVCLRERPHLRKSLQDVTYLPEQCEAPFREVACVAGGAYRALNKRGVNKNHGDIIARSKSLPLVASLPHDKGRADVAYDELGYPYAAPRHFVVKKDEAGRMTVEFAPDTIDMLSSYMLPDRGCPARSLYPYGPELGSILRLGWISIVDILLLTGAEL